MVLTPTKTRQVGRSPCIQHHHAIFSGGHKQAPPNPMRRGRTACNRCPSPRPLSVPPSGLKLGYPMKLSRRMTYEPYRAPGTPGLDPPSGCPSTDILVPKCTHYRTCSADCADPYDSQNHSMPARPPSLCPRRVWARRPSFSYPRPVSLPYYAPNTHPSPHRSPTAPLLPP